jgi:hypothetical protein
MRILAIDPGCEESAAVIWDGSALLKFWKLPNDQAYLQIRLASKETGYCVIEKIASYGMSVGASVFETCVWTGRFMEAYGAERVDRIERLRIKLHLCKDSRAKDGNIRQALIDRFGGKDAAIGKKKAPGPLFGVSGDCWSALALAVTWMDTK